MPRYIPDPQFSDCRASAGNVTFFHRDGVCYWKNKAVCEFKGTPGQLEQAELHHRALEAWRGIEHDTQPQRYRVVLKLQLTEPCRGRNGGYLRTFLALSNCLSDDAEVVFLVPEHLPEGIFSD